MFVMLAAWRGTDIHLSLVERMGLMFADAGISLTMTTLVDVFVISLDGLTQYRGVKIFCIYFVACVFFQYIYQLTFFAACLVLCGEKESKNQHPLVCIEILPLEYAGRFHCAYGVLVVGSIIALSWPFSGY